MTSSLPSLCSTPPLTSFTSWRKSSYGGRKQVFIIKCSNNNNNNTCEAKSFFLNPFDEQQLILNKALKEPVAFMGGMFAGLLRLDLNEDPLKEWVARTVEASGFTDNEVDPENATPEEVPQQIEIE
ncbi:UPF0426 protein At1g28150, chloroplastic [Rutidosis leptorrhynchoides]|uniref:UPF0426 protein At1g28150, chloroplastic n=1 Tax=Rutidosis leptorrhynchoides TaxID=125765 RepID=UPI003A9A2616